MFSSPGVSSFETGLASSLLTSTPLHGASNAHPARLRVSDSRKKRGEAPLSERVDKVLARVLGDDPAYARKVARVRRYQHRLRGRLSAPSWQLYLQVEEAEIGRWTYALEQVVGWALTPARRSRLR